MAPVALKHTQSCPRLSAPPPCCLADFRLRLCLAPCASPRGGTLCTCLGPPCFTTSRVYNKCARTSLEAFATTKHLLAFGSCNRRVHQPLMIVCWPRSPVAIRFFPLRRIDRQNIGWATMDLSCLCSRNEHATRVCGSASVGHNPSTYCTVVQYLLFRFCKVSVHRVDR